MATCSIGLTLKIDVTGIGCETMQLSGGVFKIAILVLADIL